MGVIYQLTFFFALGLLAIVVTIFVFAVSQVGRATESASREQQEVLSRQAIARRTQIVRIEEQLEEAKKVGQIDEPKLARELQKTKDEIVGYEAQLEHIQRRTALIRRRGAVIYPGIAFLLALALTITASGLTEAKNLPTLALWLWIISFGFLALGIYRLFKTLGAIEEVTITSEESVEKLPKAVKEALRELEEEKRPLLLLEFLDEQPPLTTEVNEQKEIHLGLLLVKGDIARKPEVVFFAPQGFEFIGTSTQIQPDDLGKVAGYVAAFYPFADCRKQVRLSHKLTIKASTEAGSYTLFYIISCEGFTSEYQELEVTVEEVDIPF